jgi:hypothetical protein
VNHSQYSNNKNAPTMKNHEREGEKSGREAVIKDHEGDGI